MAARAIVAERQALALIKIREQATALSGALGVDASALVETVKGDAAYQEMVRTEQLADLLGKVREAVGPNEMAPPTPEQKAAPAPARSLVDLSDDAPVSRKATTHAPAKRRHERE